jgi:hypothetical protein
LGRDGYGPDYSNYRRGAGVRPRKLERAVTMAHGLFSSVCPVNIASHMVCSQVSCTARARLITTLLNTFSCGAVGKLAR